MEDDSRFCFQKSIRKSFNSRMLFVRAFSHSAFFEISVFFYQRKAKYIYRSFFDLKRQYRFALTARYLCFIRFPSVFRHENFSGCASSARYRDFAFTSCRYFDFFCIGKVKVFIASYCTFFQIYKTSVFAVERYHRQAFEPLIAAVRHFAVCTMLFKSILP